MTRLSIETRQRVVRFRDAGYTYKEILQRYLVLALPASQHTTFVCSRGRAGGLANMYSRDHQPFLASARAYKHVLARPPALPREQTNTHSRDHQPFLASRQTRTRETTSPSSQADKHALARPPALPREQTNTFSRDHQAFLARTRTRTRERAASHSQDSRTSVLSCS